MAEARRPLWKNLYFQVVVAVVLGVAVGWLWPAFGASQTFATGTRTVAACPGATARTSAAASAPITRRSVARLPPRPYRG